MSVKKSSLLVVVTPESQWVVKNSNDISKDMEQLKITETVPHTNIFRPENLSISDRFTVSYRAPAPPPSAAPGLVPVSHANKYGFRNDKASKFPPLATNQNLIRAKHKSLPNVVIAKLLTARGLGSYYPHMYPNFKDVTLFPNGTPTAIAHDFSDHAVLKARLQINQQDSMYGMSAKKLVFDGDTLSDSESHSAVTVPNVGSTYSVVFPKRFKRRSWKKK